MGSAFRFPKFPTLTGNRGRWIQRSCQNCSRKLRNGHRLIISGKGHIYQIPNYSTELHKRSFIPRCLFQYYLLSFIYYTLCICFLLFYVLHYFNCFYWSCTFVTCIFNKSWQLKNQQKRSQIATSPIGTFIEHRRHWERERRWRQNSDRKYK